MYLVNSLQTLNEKLSTFITTWLITFILHYLFFLSTSCFLPSKSHIKASILLLLVLSLSFEYYTPFLKPFVYFCHFLSHETDIIYKYHTTWYQYSVSPLTLFTPVFAPSCIYTLSPLYIFFVLLFFFLELYHSGAFLDPIYIIELNCIHVLLCWIIFSSILQNTQC